MIKYKIIDLIIAHQLHIKPTVQFRNLLRYGSL